MPRDEHVELHHRRTRCASNINADHLADHEPQHVDVGDVDANDDADHNTDHEPDRGIMNVPDFWKRDQTGWPVDLLHFGSDAYWLGRYTRTGPGLGQTSFVPQTPQQQFGPGAAEGHGRGGAEQRVRPGRAAE